jgi:hypothetical protein
MAGQFSSLNKMEWDQLLEAVPLIGLLIAGADGNIEEEEVSWAKKVIHIRSYKLKGGLMAYYKEVDKIYSDRFTHFVETFPAEVKDRNAIITQKLTGINDVLAKIEPALGAKIYKSYLSFARHIAKATGGIMGFFAINQEEAKLVHLPMIKPIHVEPTDEEE